MKEKFPNLVIEIHMEVQEVQSPKQDGCKEAHSKTHNKMPKVKEKERILKAARERKLFTPRGVLIRLSADFSKETLQARRDWQEIFEVMKSRDLQPRSLYSTKLSFRIKGQIKSFSNKKKLKKFMIRKPLLYEMLKGPF